MEDSTNDLSTIRKTDSEVISGHFFTNQLRVSIKQLLVNYFLAQNGEVKREVGVGGINAAVTIYRKKIDSETS